MSICEEGGCNATVKVGNQSAPYSMKHALHVLSCTLQNEFNLLRLQPRSEEGLWIFFNQYSQDEDLSYLQSPWVKDLKLEV